MDSIQRDFDNIIKAIQQEDSRYDKAAYVFLRQALDYTLNELSKSQKNPLSRHISGKELLEGIRCFALREYGPMSFYLLRSWGINSCEDFGNIVFNLVESEVLGKTDEDSPKDFENGYEFKDAFIDPFEPSGRINLKTPRLY